MSLLLAADVYSLIANSIYFALAAVALWGIYCVVIVWTRVAGKRFKTEDHQNDFLDEIAGPTEQGNFQAALDMVEEDPTELSSLMQRKSFMGVNELLLLAEAATLEEKTTGPA